MSKAENQKGMRRADIEQMSTYSLEKMLLDDFYSSKCEAADMDELYMAAQILQARGTDQQNSTDQAWERFRRHYLPFAVMLSEDGGAPSSDDAHGRRQSPLQRWPIHTALVAALLCVLVLSVSVAAAANGCDLMKLLAKWTDDEVWLTADQVTPISEDDIHPPEEEREYASIQEAMEACGVTRPVAPFWHPAGYELNSVDVIDMTTAGRMLLQAHYVREEDSLVIFAGIYVGQMGENEDTLSTFQKDKGDPVPYEAGGITHLLATNAGRPIAVWVNGSVECAISGDITIEELKQMIDSIYE